MPLLVKSLPTLHFFLGFLIGALTLAFLLRIILTWYPQIDLRTGFWPIIFLPTEPILSLTRKIVAPIGATTFRVATSTGSVGKKIIGQKLVLKSIFGYQVKIILRRNARVSAPIKKPIRKCRVGRLLINRGITKLKAFLNIWYKSSFIA